jgi:hypothetical protein
VPSDARWALLEPLVEACRPEGETPPQDLRRTISATLRRHQNGARWRAVPNGLGPRWRAAQVLVRWARAPAPGGVCWTLCGSGACGQLGTAFLDGTSARAHRKAAGAARRGDLELSETSVRRLAGLGAAMAPKPARSPTGLAAPPPCGSRPVGGTSCPGPSRPSTDRRACPSGPWPTAATPAAASASTSGGHGRAAGDPAAAARGAGRLPGLDPPPPRPGRAALGQAEGAARRRDPLREGRPKLPRRPLPGRRSRPPPPQAMAGPNAEHGVIAISPDAFKILPVLV